MNIGQIRILDGMYIFYQDKSSNNKRLRDNYDIKKSSLCLLKEYMMCKKRDVVLL